MKYTGQVPKSFSASVPTSTVENAASVTSSQSCKYTCDRACVSEIHAYVRHWLDLQTRMWQPRPLAWSEAPSSRGSGLGSSSQAGLLWARAVGDISYEITWEIPSPLKSVTEMLSHGLNQDFTISYVATSYIFH